MVKYLSLPYIPDDIPEDKMEEFIFNPPTDDDPSYSFWLLVNTRMELAEIPEYFYNNFKDQLPRRLYFNDPVDTRIRIILQPGATIAFFGHGLYNILRHYSLYRGVWLCLDYYGDGEFLMKVYNLHLHEVDYPTPPKQNAFDLDTLPEECNKNPTT